MSKRLRGIGRYPKASNADQSNSYNSQFPPLGVPTSQVLYDTLQQQPVQNTWSSFPNNNSFQSNPSTEPIYSNQNVCQPIQPSMPEPAPYWSTEQMQVPQTHWNQPDDSSPETANFTEYQQPQTDHHQWQQVPHSQIDSLSFSQQQRPYQQICSQNQPQQQRSYIQMDEHGQVLTQDPYHQFANPSYHQLGGNQVQTEGSNHQPQIQDISFNQMNQPEYQYPPAYLTSHSKNMNDSDNVTINSLPSWENGSMNSNQPPEYPCIYTGPQDSKFVPNSVNRLSENLLDGLPRVEDNNSKLDHDSSANIGNFLSRADGDVMPEQQVETVMESLSETLSESKSTMHLDPEPAPSTLSAFFQETVEAENSEKDSSDDSSAEKNAGISSQEVLSSSSTHSANPTTDLNLEITEVQVTENNFIQQESILDLGLIVEPDLNSASSIVFNEDPINQEVPEPPSNIPFPLIQNNQVVLNEEIPNQQVPQISDLSICSEGHVIRPRDESPFKPPCPAASKGVIVQQEVVPLTQPDVKYPESKTVVQQVNLETFPDNLERPSDYEELRKQSPLYSSYKHLREELNSSPNSLLCDNLDLPSVTFAPAAPPLSSARSDKSESSSSSRAGSRTIISEGPLFKEGQPVSLSNQVDNLVSMQCISNEEFTPVNSTKENEAFLKDSEKNMPSLSKDSYGDAQSQRLENNSFSKRISKDPDCKLENIDPTVYLKDSKVNGNNSKTFVQPLTSDNKNFETYSSNSTSRAVNDPLNDESRTEGDIEGLDIEYRKYSDHKYRSFDDHQHYQEREYSRPSSRNSLRDHGDNSYQPLHREISYPPSRDDSKRYPSEYPSRSSSRDDLRRYPQEYPSCSSSRDDPRRYPQEYPPRPSSRDDPRTYPQEYPSSSRDDPRRYPQDYPPPPSSRDDPRRYPQEYPPPPSSRYDPRRYPLEYPARPSSRDDPRRYPSEYHPRPSSRGIETNAGDDRQNQRGYLRDPYHRGQDYYNVPHQRGYDYNHYKRYPNYPPYYDQYAYGNFNYGYYDEVYRNDPRYQQYLEECRQYYSKYGYPVDYERSSIHSGRSSVNELNREGISSHYTEPDIDSTSSEFSTFNLDQNYSYDNAHNEVPSVESVLDHASTPSSRLTPVKFSYAHPIAHFSPGGLLITSIPTQTNMAPAVPVRIHNIQAIREEEESFQELKKHQGPLIRGLTHKNDVIEFCNQKIKSVRAADDVVDRDSNILLWDLMVLLLRQNGSVAGSDIAELLLNDHEVLRPPTLPQEQSPGDANEPPSQLHSGEGSSPDEGIVVVNDKAMLNISHTVDLDKITCKFREFLLFGHKKDALEWAMKHGLWGHALFLASKVDLRTYANVMTRFANSLALTDPLQTLYQLMSGRQPIAVTNVADKKWGDWRPHLAMILSNPSGRPDVDSRSITTLGDTLANQGCLSAAHFCYIMAQVEFGVYEQKNSKLVLLSTDHMLPFENFATSEAIQLTEIYEYAQSLANPNYLLVHLQLYKYLYAMRLVEHGFFEEALHYCEIITTKLQLYPHLFQLDFITDVFKLATMLKYHDPHFLRGQGEFEDQADPDWLKNLSSLVQNYNNLLNNNQNQAHFEQPTESDQQPVNALPQQYPQPTAHNTSYPNEANSNMNNEVNSTYNHVDMTNYQQNHQTWDHQNTATSFSPNSPIENISYYHSERNNSTRSSFNQQNSLPSQEENETDIPSSPLGQTPPYDYYSRSNQQITEMKSLYEPPSSLPKSVLGRERRDSALSSSSRYSGGSMSIAKKSIPEESTKPEVKKEKQTTQAGKTWLGGIFSRLMPKAPNQMILPDDKNPTIVWDDKTQRWMNTDGNEDDELNAPAAPPSDMELMSTMSSMQTFQPSAAPSMPPMSSSSVPPTTSSAPINKFQRPKTRGMRQNYVDVLSNSGATKQTNVPPEALFPSIADNSHSMQLFTPSPMNPGNENNSSEVEPLSSPNLEIQEQSEHQSNPLMFDPSQFDPRRPSENIPRHNLKRSNRREYPT